MKTTIIKRIKLGNTNKLFSTLKDDSLKIVFKGFEKWEKNKLGT